MLRDPFYLIDNWYSGNVSANRGKNKLDFGLCIEVKKKLLPWYTKEYSQAYLKANNLEKSILTVSELYKRVIFMFDNLKLKERKKMQIIFFEDYLNQPNDYIDLICNKISCKRDKKFNNKFKKTILKSKKINKKTIDFKSFQKKYSEKISPKYKKTLIELNTLYNKFYLNNKII